MFLGGITWKIHALGTKIMKTLMMKSVKCWDIWGTLEFAHVETPVEGGVQMRSYPKYPKVMEVCYPMIFERT